MCFLLKIRFNDDKKPYLYDRYFVSNRSFTTEHVLTVINSRFFQIFFKFSQNPGFYSFFLPKLSSSRFRSKVATLSLIKQHIKTSLEKKIKEAMFFCKRFCLILVTAILIYTITLFQKFRN